MSPLKTTPTPPQFPPMFADVRISFYCIFIVIMSSKVFCTIDLIQKLIFYNYKNCFFFF